MWIKNFRWYLQKRGIKKKRKNTFSSKSGCMSVWQLSLLVDMSTPRKLEINVSMLGQFSIDNCVNEGNSIEFSAKLQKHVRFGRFMSSRLFRLGNIVLLIVSSPMTVITSKITQFFISKSWSCARPMARDGVNIYLKLQYLSSTTNDFKLLK